jgi:hypothetical protein
MMIDTRQHVVEGGLVFIQGYEFRVSDLTVHQDDRLGRQADRPFIRFIGDLTDNPRNESLQAFGQYRHGVYGGNDLVYTWGTGPLPGKHEEAQR